MTDMVTGLHAADIWPDERASNSNCISVLKLYPYPHLNMSFFSVSASASASLSSWWSFSIQSFSAPCASLSVGVSDVCYSPFSRIVAVFLLCLVCFVFSRSLCGGSFLRAWFLCAFCCCSCYYYYVCVSVAVHLHVHSHVLKRLCCMVCFCICSASFYCCVRNYHLLIFLGGRTELRFALLSACPDLLVYFCFSSGFCRAQKFRGLHWET